MTSTTTDRRQGVNAGNAIKTPCRVATTAAITLSGEQTVDGVAVVTGDRVLVKDQASALDNGIYVVDTGTWTRALDADGPYDFTCGSLIKVNNGTAGSGFWYLTTTGDITPGTTSMAFATASTYLAVVSAFMQTVLDDTTAAAARTTLGAAASADPSFTGTGLTLGSGMRIIAEGATADDYETLLDFTDPTADRTITFPNNSGTVALTSQIERNNACLSFSVGSSALTISVVDQDGATPSATTPVYWRRRAVNANSGDLEFITMTSAATLTIPSGTTLGTTNSTPFTLWVVLFDDTSVPAFPTYRLGVINCLSLTSGKHIYKLKQRVQVASASDITGVNTTHTFGATGSCSSRPYTILGSITYNAGLATAGTWASVPTHVTLHTEGLPLPGDIVQSARSESGAATAALTDQIPADNSIPTSSEGTQVFSQALTRTLDANLVRVRHEGIYSISSTAVATVTVLKDAVADAYAAKAENIVTNATNQISIEYVAPPLAVGAEETWRIYAGPSSGVNLYMNADSAGTRLFGGVASSFLEVEEIQT